MQMIADLHTHTLCATHAFQTLNEMAAAAKDCGYKALAITDHAPAMPDAPHRWHFENPTALPRTIAGMVMLYGAEANVVDAKGHLDLPPRILEYQDWVVASIHSPCVPGLLTRKEANRIWLAVAENPYVDLATKGFAGNDTVLGLDRNSFNVRKDANPNMESLLAACLQNGCHIAVDSDAHSTWQLRHGLTALYGMLEEMNFPEELIINATTANLTAELKLHGKACAEEVGGILV